MTNDTNKWQLTISFQNKWNATDKEKTTIKYIQRFIMPLHFTNTSFNGNMHQAIRLAQISTNNNNRYTQRRKTKRNTTRMETSSPLSRELEPTPLSRELEPKENNILEYTMCSTTIRQRICTYENKHLQCNKYIDDLYIETNKA